MRLDHLAIAAETLEDGVAWAEARFGVPFLPGGTHERFGTHNRLLGLEDDLYLEVIAVDPQATSEGPRWFDLDNFTGPPRLTNWICEPTDFEAALRHGMRSVPMARGDLRWDMGAPADGSLPLGGAYPTVLRWHTDTPPGRALPSSGVRLIRLQISHPQAAEVEAQIGAALNDTRIQFLEGPLGLSATFDTPRGEVTL